MIIDEIISTLFVVGGITALCIMMYLLSKIPGSGIIFRIIRSLFLILWRIIVFGLTFFMFFMVGYMVIVFFTFTGNEEGILLQGEPVNILIGDHAERAAFFIMLYAGFCLVFVYIISLLLAFGRSITRFHSSFHAEIVLVIMIILVFTVFPMVVEAILPDFKVGRYGKYTLGILPLTMYIQGQTKKIQERRGRGRYLSSKERFYRDLGKKESNHF